MTAPIAVKEFDQEMATTRRLLERVPGDKGSWKPHDKSFPVGHLAQLLSWMPEWIAITLREPALDLAGATGYSFQPTDVLLAEFDRNVAAARSALKESDRYDMDAEWRLTHGQQTLFSAPRGETVRMHLRHLIHHRGQLSVYLRLLDVPVPQIYGPSADEGWAGPGR